MTGFGPSTVSDLPAHVHVGLDLARDAMDASVLLAQASNSNGPASLRQVNMMLRESMEAYICNCAPGRHEMFRIGPDRV